MGLDFGHLLMFLGLLGLIQLFCLIGAAVEKNWAYFPMHLVFDAIFFLLLLVSDFA